MEMLIGILKFIGPELAFPCVLIFGILWFLLKILNPLINSIATIFKDYVDIIKNIENIMSNLLEEKKEIRIILKEISDTIKYNNNGKI